MDDQARNAGISLKRADRELLESRAKVRTNGNRSAYVRQLVIEDHQREERLRPLRAQALAKLTEAEAEALFLCVEGRSSPTSAESRQQKGVA